MERYPGRYIEAELDGNQVRAFVPAPLPPAPPPRLDEALGDQLRRAELELSRLDVLARLAPTRPWLVRALVRVEAAASCRLAGARASLADLLAHEARDELGRRQVAAPEVQELANLVAASRHVRAEIEDPAGLPLSLRLLREAHRIVLRRGRGAAGQPGEIRRVLTGYPGTRPGLTHPAPAPPGELDVALADFEAYLHSGDDQPPLVRIALLQAQVELLQPFLTGNGRTARLLAALLLERWRLLAAPLLPLSRFLAEHREEYRARLSELRRTGDWERWLWFFLEGVGATAHESTLLVTDLLALVAEDRARILAAPRGSLAALRLFAHLLDQPVLSAPEAARRLQTTKPTVGKAIGLLTELGVLREITGRRRDRRHAYAALLGRLGESP